MMDKQKYKKLDTVQKGEILSDEDSENIELDLGEYFLHIYLQYSQNLNLDDVTNVKVQIKAMGESQYSDVQQSVVKSSKTFWGEHYFFSKKFDSRQELNDSYVEVTFFKHSAIAITNVLKLNSSKIGSFSYSLLRIYAAKDHSIINQWNILTNPQKSYKDIMGFVKLSANFIRVGQPRADLEALLKDHQEEDFNKLQFPPNILIDKKQIVIKLFRGDNIVPLDTLTKKADPFVKFNLGGITIKSKVCKNTLNPVFNQILYLPTISPSLVQTLKMCYKDWDSFGSNDFIGSYHFKMEDIEKNYYKEPRWFYTYGAYGDKIYDKEIFQYMNSYPDVASRFKGQILLSIEFYDVQNEDQKHSIEDFKQGDEIVNLENRNYSFKVDLEYVQNIKLEPQPCYIEFNWGGKTLQTQSTNYDLGVLKFFQSYEISNSFQINPKLIANGETEYDQLPDLIISVVQDGKYYSYYRIKPREFIYQENSKYNIYNFDLIADNSVSDLQDHQSGILSAALICFNKNIFQTINWKGQFSNNYEKIMILCNIYQAKDLLPSDADGSADPRILFYNLGNSSFSTIFQNSLNPTWNQTIKLQTFKINNKIPSLILQVYDNDKHSLTDDTHDFMGSCVIDLGLSNYMKHKNDIKEPPIKRWYDIRQNKKQTKGKILCSFLILDTQAMINNQKYLMSFVKFKPIEMQNTQQTLIRLNIMGLRNLQSSGIFPIKRIQMRIDTSSLKRASDVTEGNSFNEYVINSQTQGKDPTLGSVVTFEAHLSTDCNHIPSLSCRVLDTGIKFGENVIGTFHIDLGIYAFRTLTSLKLKLQGVMNRINIIKNLGEGINKQEKFDEIFEKSFSKDAIQDYFNRISILERFIFDLKNQVRLNEQQLEDIDSNKLVVQNIKNKIEQSIQNSMQQLGNIISSKKLDLLKKISMQKNEQKEIKEGRFGEMKKRGLQQQYSQMQMIQESDIDKLDIVYEAIYEIDTKQQSERKIENNSLNLAKTSKKQTIKWKENEKFRSIMEDLIDRGEYQEIGYTKFGPNNTLLKRKQYRKVIKEGPLDKFYLEEEFIQTIPIHRGKKLLQKQNFWEKFFTYFQLREEQFKVTGKMKGVIEVLSDYWRSLLRELKLNEQIKKEFGLIQYFESSALTSLEQEILRQETVRVIVNVLYARLFKSEDYNSENDSYFYVKLGNKEIKNAKIVMNDNNPKYYETFKFEHTFPGASDLIIDFFDYDPFDPRDKLGQVVIDLERRFFDKKWRSLKNIPIERQDIIQEENGQIVGELFLFVDILTSEDQKTINIDQEKQQRDLQIQNSRLIESHLALQSQSKLVSKNSMKDKKIEYQVSAQDNILTEEDQPSVIKYLFEEQKKNKINNKLKSIPDISLRPPTPVEIRIVIWEANDIPSDDFEDVSDLYCQVRMNSFDLSNKTDVHYRAAYNFASWNWRIIFKLDVLDANDANKYVLDFFIYDRDLLSSNDYICHSQINIQKIIKSVVETETRNQYLDSEKNDEELLYEFPIYMTLRDNINSSRQPKLKVSIDVLTKKEAELSPAGVGRSDPNQDPYLPQPVGRFEWSWNPLKILGQLCGPDFKRNLGMILCLVLVILLVFWFMPVLLTLIVSLIVN